MSLTMNTFQLQGTAMCSVFATAQANLSMGFREIKLPDLIELNYNLDIRQFLDDWKILLNINLINRDDLLTIINSVNNGIQFSMELSDNKLPFLDILITKSGKKNWMNFYSKPNESKHCFLPF